MALAQLRQNMQDDRGADQLFAQALELLDASNAHELAGTAYSRYATLLERRGEVQRSLDAFKKAYQHQSHGTRGMVD
jgi:tetratricopeptide (TPR) repeat protein